VGITENREEFVPRPKSKSLSLKQDNSLKNKEIAGLNREEHPLSFEPQKGFKHFSSFSESKATIYLLFLSYLIL
jgi:hypothetical protein